ncbi:MAG: right-handed parallel beta-helix repeat-containing protein, partial [Paludibacteraceae bacterium]|nr:right-handed parallel beta-helix repeat-containing protein [Paludibacteraceae bacterium]
MIEGNDITHVVNNTFVNNHVPCFNLGKTLIEGNIIISDTTIGGYLGTFGKSNLVSDNISVEGVISVPFSEFGFFLDGVYDLNNNTFIPNFADNGGFTPTIALKSDKLSDGKSIRFPRLENVLTDQRGVTRLDSTCMGAYEIKCSPVVTELKDTVFVGDSYSFNGSDLDDVCQNVGSYYFSDTLTGSGGCDSIVNLSLAVRPQKRETGYYVKVDGTGDGSDWENAMSPKDFAEYLPLVNDGETFHIAAGTYKSTYVDPELGRMYNINSSVTLIGGYPDTVTVVGVPPMPETYTTTLSADVNSGDDIEIYTNRSGDYSLYGFEDNDSILISVNGTPTVSIYGITLSGVKSDKYGAVTMNDGGTLNLDKCAIMTNNSSGVVASNAKINVTSTLAYHNVTKNGAVFRLTDSELNVEHSSFHENVSSGESSDAKGTVANLTNSQSTFTNNTVANNWADMGAVFALSNSQVSLSNNTLVGNQSIAKDPKGSFVVASDSKSKVTLFGNMIVGNGAQPVDGAAIESEGYNIFSTDFQGMGVESDMFMGSKDYEFVMDGTPLSGNADVFIANVNDNGGFTPTVAVIESMFDGGAVISIPSSQRKVEFDQREMVRKDTSCVGAFEFPTYVNYFVKQSPVGDGTGRDWDNAMGDTTFFRYFSIVPSGATFHVAAGTYHPLGDRLYNTDSYKNRQFFSSRPLNVFGGYHPQAQMGAVADPSKYVTLLSADF